MAPVVEHLHREGSGFEFHQAVRLLEEYYRRHRGSIDPIAEGRIRFAVDPSLAFPAGDISGVRAGPESAELVLSFMGLAGSSSPLAGNLAGLVARHGADDSALGDFLAIFTNRLHALYHRAWEKHQAVCDDPPAHDFSGILAKVLTLTEADTSAEPDLARARAACAGALVRQARSARGLSSLVSHYCRGARVKVEEFVPRPIRPASRPALGSGFRLGHNGLIGDTAVSVTTSIRIVVGPVRRPDYDRLRDEKAGSLRRLVGEYLADPLDFEIEILLATEDLAPVRLGTGLARLGENAILGSAWRQHALRTAA